MSAQPIPEKRSRRKLILILTTVLVLGAAGAGGWWWWSGQAQAGGADAAAAAAKAPALYFALEPAFVVNLVDAQVVRYLQADVQLMTRDAETATALEAHAPAVRNRLLLLFGQQSATQLAQRTAKERLQEQALAEVRDVLKAEGAADRVEAVYFTSLVTQ
ncbi:flagellar basal body-associated FliL family protein [Lysobacter sp. A3-1-A15]|uniref:flagellar basal body-associated FliL family protein n=1 Tax=Novilysobacter viscosus TaxID=3098602 RepID=UPI002EDA6EF6